MSTIAAPTQIPTATWAIDPVHSSIGFGVKHLGISTYRGSFPAVSGTVETRDGGLSAVDGAVQVDSLVTQDANLTGHLLGPDFFEAPVHPEARFVSTRIEQRPDGAFRVDGELTLRGATRPVVLEGEIEGAGADAYGGQRIGLVAKGQIDRTEFGINFNSPLANGTLAIGEKVSLELHVEAVAQEQA
jgi:polyisoprenoid-binding protein YceI